MNETISDATALALLLETACEQFETLAGCMEGRIKITSEPHNWRAVGCIHLALAKQFLFNTIRAYRICKGRSDLLTKNPDESRAFRRLAEELLKNVRNVNEHGFDPLGVGWGHVLSLDSGEKPF